MSPTPQRPAIELVTAAGAMALAKCSRRTLDRAIAAGALSIAGRRGGRGARMLRVADVLAWAVAAPDADAPRPPPRPRQTTRASAGVTAAVSRINAIATGGAK